MATTVLTDARIELNSVVNSSKSNQVMLPVGTAKNDASVFGTTTKIYAPGLIDFSATINFFNDFTDDALDEAMNALWAARTIFAVKIRLTSSTIGPANPEYQFSAFIEKWTPLAGKVGDLVQSSLVLCNTTALTRAVA